MPSPVHGSYYRRKGGAYRKSHKGHGYKKVGSGHGMYAKRNLPSDRRRRARKSGLRRRYPQHYD